MNLINNSDKGKICALMRQSWYETAKKNMKPLERLAFYEACFEYEFTMKEPNEDELLPMATIMFDMVRDTIDRDREKAINITNRNRENGKNGGRPSTKSEYNKPIETQANPSNSQNNPSLNLGTTVHNNILQNTTDYIFRSLNRSKIEIELLFYCTLFFFEQGAANAIAEGEKFFSYYQARGWKTNSGVAVSDKYALAKGWKIENKSIEAAQNRKYYCSLLSSLRMAEIGLISDFIRLDINNETGEAVLMLNTEKSARLIDSSDKKTLKAWFEMCNLTSLNYRIPTS